MLLYHASPVNGLTELLPEKAFNKKVFLATRLEDCCAYLANPILLYCKRNNIPTPPICWRWAVNDRDTTTNTPILLEWWKGAFKELYKGVSSNYYVVEENENITCSNEEANKLRKFYASNKPIKVKSVIKVPDIYKELKRLAKDGKIILCKFKNLSSIQIKKIKSFVNESYTMYNQHKELIAFLNAKLSFYKDN